MVDFDDASLPETCHFSFHNSFTIINIQKFSVVRAGHQRERTSGSIPLHVVFTSERGLRSGAMAIINSIIVYCAALMK